MSVGAANTPSLTRRLAIHEDEPCTCVVQTRAWRILARGNRERDRRLVDAARPTRDPDLATTCVKFSSETQTCPLCGRLGVYDYCVCDERGESAPGR